MGSGVRVTHAAPANTLNSKWKFNWHIALGAGLAALLSLACRGISLTAIGIDPD